MSDEGNGYAGEVDGKWDDRAGDVPGAMLELESPPRKSFSGSVESIVLDREGWPTPTPGVETGIELAELSEIREFVRVGEGAREEGRDDAADAGVEWVEWCHRTMMAERHGGYG
jgi:hypothetical protein